MEDKAVAEATYKTLEFVKTLTDDPAKRIEILSNAKSFIENQIIAEGFRQAMFKALNP